MIFKKSLNVMFNLYMSKMTNGNKVYIILIRYNIIIRIIHQFIKIRGFIQEK